MGSNGPHRLKTGQNRRKMAQKGLFDPPQGSGPTFEKNPFLTVFGPMWPGCRLAVGGCRLAVGGGWQLMAVGDCQLAV